jgi:hypothetical protein
MNEEKAKFFETLSGLEVSHFKVTLVEERLVSTMPSLGGTLTVRNPGLPWAHERESSICYISCIEVHKDSMIVKLL